MSVAAPSSIGASRSRPSSFLLAMASRRLSCWSWSINYIVGKITLKHLDALTLASFRFRASARCCSRSILAGAPHAAAGARHVDIRLSRSSSALPSIRDVSSSGSRSRRPRTPSIVVALGPILILAMASAMKLENADGGKIPGMLISFSGVLLLETDSGSPLHSPLAARRPDHSRGHARLFDLHRARQASGRRVRHDFDEHL